MQIRKIELRDLEDLQKLYQNLCENQQSLEQMQITFRKMVNNDAYILLGAEVDGKIVGTLMGVVCHDLVGEYRAFMTIENVVVREDYRRRGIATQLFKTIEAFARDRECAYIYLVSGPTRLEAHQMYNYFGYGEEGALGFRKWLK